MNFRTTIGMIFAGTLTVCAPEAAPAPSTVTIKNFSFGPSALTVTAGTTVTWNNADGEPHTVVSASGLFRSAALDSGESFSYTFTKTGTFTYVCTIHTRMVAAITVT